MQATRLLDYITNMIPGDLGSRMSVKRRRHVTKLLYTVCDHVFGAFSYNPLSEHDASLGHVRK